MHQATGLSLATRAPVHVLRDRHLLVTDWASTALAGEEAPAILEAHRGALRSCGVLMPFAQDRAVGDGGIAALALAALASRKTTVGFVDGDPFPVLSRLAAAGRKGRQALGADARAIAAAVVVDPLTQLVGGESRPAFARHWTARRMPDGVVFCQP